LLPFRQFKVWRRAALAGVSEIHEALMRRHGSDFAASWAQAPRPQSPMLKTARADVSVMAKTDSA
jgi:hypothetical protein